jgi:hypothetical protein
MFTHLDNIFFMIDDHSNTVMVAETKAGTFF